MNVFEELKERGLIAQMTHEEEIKRLLDTEKVTFYIGFDPTADSLHIGHFLQLVVMAHMQRAGHTPIALIGGGTAMVGDPTGRTDMRKMMTEEVIEHNSNCFKKQMSNLIDFSDGKAMMVNNADWLLDLNYIKFLREIGVHFSVNRMLTFECFKTRLEKGLSFIEFNYMLMQSYDFYKLFNEKNCVLELGGDDQWSNIIGGIELIRRINGKEAYGMTFTLLTTSDGKKMGKTQNGAVWIDPEKTTPYEFFQYWRNIDDADVIRCMKMLTFIPLEEIREFEKCSGSEINSLKERLAYEITSMVHGKDEADKAIVTARDLFSGKGDTENMPSTAISLSAPIDLTELLVTVGLCSSKGEGRRLIEQGGIALNDNKITDVFSKVDNSLFNNGELIIKKGKKIFHKVTIE